jgi:hypothetical protein
MERESIGEIIVIKKRLSRKRLREASAGINIQLLEHTAISVLKLSARKWRRVIRIESDISSALSFTAKWRLIWAEAVQAC